MPTTIVKTDTFSRMAKVDRGSCENNYKGLAIHSLTGLHEHVESLVQTLFPQKSHLVDIAAGSGALSLRLKDMGHVVSACDYVADNFRLFPDVEFAAIDLNTDFSQKLDKSVDGILAIEIIEHLENPRHFLREIHSLLKPGGSIILTTPNIDNPVSLAFFVRHGWHQWFDEASYHENGHITPISLCSMRRFLAEAGFESVAIHSFGDPFRRMMDLPKMRLLARFLAFISKRERNVSGEILVVTARKPF